ncbi:nucleolar protein 14 [Multifurca ochricompacta]|uniref:Nucleolar protein 14 n=1 Tax=Multifurca ochricompacta TaxID=376703 RepID=A0AAD4MD89_9AGAM|nr:nucleolar protein 14 [Multifurca ochricompacta]
MGKGSQLSQLKSALSQAGLFKKSKKGRKRKGAQNEGKDNAKRAARLREIQQKLNPFDVKVTKLKHDVGGRKLKGVSGRPAQSKQAGIEARKKILLKEFQEKDRAGGVFDRRFGENDPTLTPEERMLERFTQERRRSLNRGAFNLEDEVDLTHYGQSLSKLDDFADTGLRLSSDDEETNDRIDGEVVERSHFGGFGSDSEAEDDPARKKTKADVMAEVIAKSKEHKVRALRQKQREEADDIRHQLDQELDTIRGLLSAPDPLSESLENRSGHRGSGVSGEDYDQQYDQFVRELVFDQRSKPKDRTKTEEELAFEAKIALERAERQRIRRMNGEDDAEDSDDGRPGKRKRLLGGDDLEDDLNADDWDGLGGGLKPSLDSSSESGTVNGSSDNDYSTSEDGESDLEPRWDGLTGGNDSDSSALALGRNGPQGPITHNELPYTFPCPSSHEEFLEIIEGLADQEISIVVERIRALHHPSFGAENPPKLQILVGVIIDHILHVASPPNPRLSIVSGLLPHLRVLIKMYPRQAAEHFIRKLVLMHKNLTRGLKRDGVDSSAKTWPSLPELVLLRVLGALWPTSDMHHVVVSPARLLMGSYLGLCKIRSLTDAASGLFLCTLFLQYESLSKRFVPEVINFLIHVVWSMSPRRGASVEPERIPHSSVRLSIEQLCVLGKGKGETLLVNRPDFVAVISGGRPSAQANIDLLGLAVDLLKQFSELCKTLDGFVELYSPVLLVLGGVDSDVLCPTLQDRISGAIDAIQRLLRFSLQARRPLRLQAHKPIPIPSYIPKFESTSSSYLRMRDPDRERQAAAKLRKEYKEERKGAIRELRKDARFLAGVEQEKQREKDRSYHERMKRVFGNIEVERAEEKALEREKAKERRRAGRK